MNKAFDYNGVQVSHSKPVQKLVKRSRVLHLDSADRDTSAVFFPRNGSFTLYLPRAYERVTSINIKDAEFPSLDRVSIWDTVTNTATAPTTGTDGVPGYFFMEIKELNMSDETAVGADRSAFTNSVFAKFVSPVHAEPVIYNESSNAHQTIEFFPALNKLDRFQIKLRSHGMPSTQYLYWNNLNWSMSIEIETLENAFDEFSSMETRIGDRA
jgi:hypothetical protein